LIVLEAKMATHNLTPREVTVLKFIVAGYSNKKIARILDLSVRTVETHRLNLRRKIAETEAVDVVDFMRRSGIDPIQLD
jgi:DNA-binding CsgD family transcriptional regulator